MDKHQILQEESTVKRSLRDQPRVKPKKIIQYDEEQEEKLIQNKSKRWWVRVNRKYFPVLTYQQVYQHKLTLEQKQLVIPLEITKPKVSSFFTANIYSKEPRLFDRKGIKVLFKKQLQADQNILSQEYYAINYFFNLSQQEILKNFKTQILTQKSIPLQQQTLSVKCLNLVNNQLSKAGQIEIQELQQLGLSMNRATSNIEFITDVLNYEVDRLLPNGQNQMENEVMLWEKQLTKISIQNDEIWEKMFNKFRMIQAQEDQDFISNQIRQGSDLELMMGQMFKFLSWKDVLLNFKKGYSDKTQDMLAEALQIMYIKQNMNHQKKLRRHNQKVLMNKCELNGLFQTDCKICFSTYSSQKNRVVYCDKCNDSFHEGCYGIQQLDKNLDFICDSCHYLVQCGNNRNIQKLKTTCSICSIPFFPTKNINGNFYHPACLFLNNLIQHKSGKIQLRQEFQHNKILDMISANQISVGPCEYCMETTNRGFRVQCSVQGCKKCYHHTCAYLNAGVFDIWRNDKSLQVKVSCHEHHQGRDFYRQAYLRRFFCDFNKTSNLSQQQFIQIYDQQLMQIRQFRTSYDPISLIKISKIITEYKQSYLRKKVKEKQQKRKRKRKQHKEKNKHHKKQNKKMKSKQKQKMSKQSINMSRQSINMSRQSINMSKQSINMSIQNKDLSMQNKDLNIQNKDLRRQNNYLSGQCEDLSKQRKDISRQSKNKITQKNNKSTQSRQSRQSRQVDYKNKITLQIQNRHSMNSQNNQISFSQKNSNGQVKKQANLHKEKYRQQRTSIIAHNTKIRLVKKPKRKNSLQQKNLKNGKISSNVTLSSKPSKINKSFALQTLSQRQIERQKEMKSYFQQALHNKNYNMFSFNVQLKQNSFQNEIQDHRNLYDAKQKSSDYSVIDLQTIQSQCDKKIMISCQSCSL